jgi:hypothetical protein
MEPIDRIHCIQKERWELLCCICRQRMGAKIQCHDCYQVGGGAAVCIWLCVQLIVCAGLGRMAGEGGVGLVQLCPGVVSVRDMCNRVFGWRGG